MRPRRGILATALIAIVAVVIAAAIRVVGTPGEARLRRLDEQRVSDLQEIAGAVTDYYRRGGKQLPATLDAIASTPNRTVTIRDPDTRAVYGYRVVAPDAYQLCAGFARPAEVESASASQFWTHSAGAHCFRVTMP
jgi:hypothetical protein